MLGLRRNDDRELQPGDALGPYRLEEPLGEGGMGLVFRARRQDEGSLVALKVLRLELAEDEVFRRRFEQEARAAAEIRHPNLVPILEAGEARGREYLAVGYVEGGTLTDRLEKRGPLGAAETIRLAREIGGALDALHAAGIVHRDVKASNILFGTDDAALLTDFGLAKGRAYTVLTRPGQVMGTLDYLAPELIRGKPATSATDVYALGCTAFECLAGQPPFADRSVFQIGLAHLEEPPPDPAAQRPDVSPEFSKAVLAALEKEPERRPATGTAYADLLQAAFEGRVT